jgi:hypothetical protein
MRPGPDVPVGAALRPIDQHGDAPRRAAGRESRIGTVFSLFVTLRDPAAPFAPSAKPFSKITSSAKKRAIRAKWSRPHCPRNQRRLRFHRAVLCENARRLVEPGLHGCRADSDLRIMIGKDFRQNERT